MSSSATLMISVSRPRRSKKARFRSSGMPSWPQSHMRFAQPKTATADRLIARCTSSSDGDSRTDGTLSWTSTSKKGRWTKRNPVPPRAQTRFLIWFSEFRAQLSSAWYVIRL